MSHPNEYPGKIFDPGEGTMPVTIVEMPITAYPANREGIYGVSQEDREAAGEEALDANVTMDWDLLDNG